MDEDSAMTRVYHDRDADLKQLAGRTVASLGYGNQGRAQALNLRDSGVRVIVGNRRDKYRRRVVADGFQPVGISDAVRAADVLLFLIPDEVQRAVYEARIAPHLRRGQTLVFAHGYNIHYRLIVPPPGVDVVMVAPRMIGRGVRELFQRGRGASAFVAVAQDATGRAWKTALAVAKGIGATRAGAIRTTFAVETEMDHFMEQVLWAALMRVFQLGFETLIEAGYPPELVALEMWGSKEAAEIFMAAAEVGLYKQAGFHSQTSQYGTLSRGPVMLPAAFKKKMRAGLAAIRSGEFAREWERERRVGYPKFRALKTAALTHPLNAAEARMRRLVKE